MNPFSTMKKLVKSKPYIDQMEKDVKQMGAKNWKTTTCGLLLLGVSLAQIWAPPTMKKQIEATQAALLAAGFLSAKDKDVTGGSRQQY